MTKIKTTFLGEKCLVTQRRKLTSKKGQPLPEYYLCFISHPSGKNYISSLYHMIGEQYALEYRNQAYILDTATREINKSEMIIFYKARDNFSKSGQNLALRV